MRPIGVDGQRVCDKGIVLVLLKRVQATTARCTTVQLTAGGTMSLLVGKQGYRANSRLAQ